MLIRISAFFDEAVMGLLALAGLGFGFAPSLFDLSSSVDQGFDIAKWVIIGLFAIEYLTNLSLSSDRLKFVISPWRVLDMLIIVVPFFSLLPSVPELASSTPALRILRLFSILLFGWRFVSRGLQQPTMPLLHSVSSNLSQVTIFQSDAPAPRQSTWDDLLDWVVKPTSGWLHASNLSPENLMKIAEAAGVSHVMIESALQESSFPRLESGSHWTVLTVSLPSVGDTIHRDPILLLVSEHSMLSFSLRPLDLQPIPLESGTLPWGPRCVLHVISMILTRDEELAGRLEREVRQLEELPAIDSPDSFFKQTFHLKRVLSMSKSDLWRLRGLLEMLVDGRRKLPGLELSQRKLAAPLVEEADYLYETVDNIRESVLSLIELHINIAAHSTNRFMRLLMIVSTLSLIPAVLGGLLGMNLVEAPWPITLGQVAFGALVLSLGVLYIFLAKGWLR